MFELIKKVAFEDENILAVYYGGSRANPTIKPDIYQDYDVVFVVKEVEPYTKDHSLFLRTETEWIFRYIR